jgi:hypothetical protein
MQVLGILVISVASVTVWEGSKGSGNFHFSVVLHVIPRKQQQTSFSQNKQPSHQPQCILYIAKSFTKSHTQNEDLFFCLIFCCESLCEPYEGILLPYTVCPEGKN